MPSISKIANDMLAKSHPHPVHNPTAKPSSMLAPQTQIAGIIKSLNAAIKAEPDPMDQAQLAKALLIVKQVYAKNASATG